MTKNVALIGLFTLWFSLVASQDASISFLFPADNSTVPENFVAKFEIENFSFPEDGYIKVLMESDSFDDIVFHYGFHIDWVNFTLPEGSNSILTLELVDTNQNPFNPRILSTINVNSVQSIDVSNLAELRSGNDTDFYKITHDVYILYDRPEVNQTYLDDGSAGILMDDFFYTALFGPQNVPFNSYTDIIGRLVEDNRVLKLIPYIGTSQTVNESEIIFSDNPNVSFNDLIHNLNDYESEIITLEGGNFIGLAPGQVFEEDTTYTLSNGNETLIFKSIFSEADYIGMEIPEVFNSITGIVSQFDGIAQITAISVDAIDTSSLSTSSLPQTSFHIFPNPSNNGIIKIKSDSAHQTELTMKVYNPSGQLVMSKKSTENELDLSMLSKGVYFIQIEHHESNSIKKLIIN